MRLATYTAEEQPASKTNATPGPRNAPCRRQGCKRAPPPRGVLRGGGGGGGSSLSYLIPRGVPGRRLETAWEKKLSPRRLKELRATCASIIPTNVLHQDCAIEQRCGVPSVRAFRAENYVVGNTERPVLVGSAFPIALVNSSMTWGDALSRVAGFGS